MPPAHVFWNMKQFAVYLIALTFQKPLWGIIIPQWEDAIPFPRSIGSNHMHNAIRTVIQPLYTAHSCYKEIPVGSSHDLAFFLKDILH